MARNGEVDHLREEVVDANNSYYVMIYPPGSDMSV